MSDILPISNRQLVCMEDACRCLAEAKSIDEVSAIRDQAEAMKHYYVARNYGLAAINDAAEIKVRSERRLGELLADMPKNPGGRSTCDTLSQVGVERHESSRWQRIASIPEMIFESHIAEVRSKNQELTTAGLLKLAKNLQQPGKQTSPPLADGCTVEDLQQLINNGESFGTLYIDPPWSYSNQATRASTDNHYQTMTVEQIAALPVGQLAADYSHLHLWTTNAFLRDSFDLIDAWGFTYQGIFVWCKPQIGIGNCWRVSHEFLMLAIRGEPRRFAVHNLRSWAALERDKHSAKPGLVRTWIEQASPGPYLELFARIPVNGWTTWGNEIPRDKMTSDKEVQREMYGAAPYENPSLFTPSEAV